jgi:hypothetical protein
MSTGNGIVVAMIMYVCWQGFLVWRADNQVRRPAALEARVERLEKLLLEAGISYE